MPTKPRSSSRPVTAPPVNAIGVIAHADWATPSSSLSRTTTAASSTPNRTAPRTPPTSQPSSPARWSGCANRAAARSRRFSLTTPSYTGHRFAATLDQLDARHIRIPPYTPRCNGTLERFFRTLHDERAHGRVWPDSATHDRAPSSFLRHFNRWRPHSSATGRPPLTRVHQDRKQDS